MLDQARQSGRKTSLATMSCCEHPRRVLAAVKFAGAFGFIATRDDVERGKRDSEIYQMVARELDVPAAAWLVIEDSFADVRTALEPGCGAPS